MILIDIPPEVKEIMDSPRAYVVPEEVAKVLKIDSMALRKMVRAGQIDFPFFDTGTRIRFPKLPFLRWLGYEVNGGTKNEENGYQYGYFYVCWIKDNDGKQYYVFNVKWYVVNHWSYINTICVCTDGKTYKEIVDNRRFD